MSSLNVVLRVSEDAVEFVWWVGGVGWGLQSHFRVQPNHCVEVPLRCVVVGVVTIVNPTAIKVDLRVC